MSEPVQIPAGSPVHINLGAPPAASEPAKSVKRGEREERARAEGANGVLKALGVKKDARARMLEEIKGGRVKLAEAKAELAEAKTQVDVKAAEADAFKPYKDQVDSLSNTLKEYADAEFAALPESFQKTLIDMKTEDPKARLDVIKIWKKNGIITASQAQAATAVVKDEAKPSTTMATAPKDVKAPPGPASNHYEQWKQLTDSKQTYLAAQYLKMHQSTIFEQMPKPSRA